MMMMMMTIIIILFSLLPGCATYRALGPIPTDLNEFELPIASLESSYPELDVYKLGNLFVGYCTPVNQLTKLWGEPDEKKTVWLQVPILAIPIALVDGVTTGGTIAIGIAYAMFPKQPQHYIWRKGNYEIDAYVSTEIGCGYKPRLWNWKWKQILNN